jgi:ribosomal protein L34
LPVKWSFNDTENTFQQGQNQKRKKLEQLRLTMKTQKGRQLPTAAPAGGALWSSSRIGYSDTPNISESM